MTYERIIEGRFIDRPNRFIAHVELSGKIETVHVRNTGRCRELLVPGARVWVQESLNPARKTKYDLITVQKGGMLINMDSQAPNAAFGEYLAAGRLIPAPSLIRPETVFGDSRLDFYLEGGGRRAFCEVKGVTLEEDGVARFPDAPTARGTKHLRELVRAHEAGFEAYAVFVVQMERVRYFEPNASCDGEFAAALRDAKNVGVNILCLNCEITPKDINILGSIEYNL